MNLFLTIMICLFVLGSSVAFFAADKATASNVQAGSRAQHLDGPSKPVAVRVGGEPEMDACGALSKVSGLRKGGDGFLAVRDAPDVRAREVDRLKNADFVIECDAKGDWVGIVFESSPAARKKHPTSCGTSSPKKERGPYQGPCKSGWAHRKWITLEAG